MYKLRDFVGSLLKKLWGFLTAPLEKMRHAEDERRAKVVTAFFLFCTVAITIDQMMAGNIPRLASWFLLGGYFLARTRWYKIATIILIVILTVPVYLIVVKSPNIEPYEVFAALVWVILPLLLVSLIFSVRTAILIYAANIAAVLAMPFLYSHLSFRDIGEALGFFILTSLVILIVMIEQIKLEDIRQAELRRSQERFYKIFHTSPDAISISELENGRIIEINNSFSSMLGFAPGECIGRTSIELNLYVNPTDRFEMVRLLKEHSEINEYEFHLRHKDGTQFSASASVSPIELDGKACLIWMARDVTTQKQNEAQREKLFRELEQRNAELERLACTLSHELKSPLITIRGFLGYLREDSINGNSTRLASDIQRISDGTEKMQRLITELLELLSVGRIVNPFEEVSFRTLVDEAVDLVHERIVEQGIAVHIADDLPHIYGDHKRLVEILQNLIENSAKYMGNQPEPRIEIGQQVGGDNMPVFFVRDNGIGMEPRFKERIFDIFAKLDAQSEGTGIGLALVKRIVEVHGGRIWVESEGLGKGSTFYFTIRDSRT